MPHLKRLLSERPATCIAVYVVFMVTANILNAFGVLGFRLTIWLIVGPFLAFMVGLLVVMTVHMIRQEWSDEA